MMAAIHHHFELLDILLFQRSEMFGLFFGLLLEVVSRVGLWLQTEPLRIHLLNLIPQSLL